MRNPEPDSYSALEAKRFPPGAGLVVAISIVLLLFAGLTAWGVAGAQGLEGEYGEPLVIDDSPDQIIVYGDSDVGVTVETVDMTPEYEDPILDPWYGLE